MEWFEALILGIIQGLTEFLPVSSSGHLEIGKAILGVEYSDNLTFTVVVHGATVLSTIIVFRKTILDLFTSIFRFRWDENNQYIVKIIISMIPVILVGLFMKDFVEQFFDGNIIFVGFMLLVTTFLLFITYFAKDRERKIGYKDAFVIGIAQALAVLPGISRSGSTIATGLMLGNNKKEVAKFSFLMVLLPIIGANLLDIVKKSSSVQYLEAFPLIIGFFAAFISGLIACRLMLHIVQKGRLIYFAIYTLIIGLVAIIFGF